MTQITANPWCELCTDRIQEGCFGCNIDTPPTANNARPSIAHSHNLATLRRRIKRAAVTIAAQPATEHDKWIGLFLYELGRAGVDVELLECALESR